MNKLQRFEKRFYNHPDSPHIKSKELLMKTYHSDFLTQGSFQPQKAVNVDTQIQDDVNCPEKVDEWANNPKECKHNWPSKLFFFFMFFWKKKTVFLFLKQSNP
jgi:hypothetical protein